MSIVLRLCCSLAPLAPSLIHAATLGIPGPGTTLSGIGVISGWKCQAMRHLRRGKIVLLTALCLVPCLAHAGLENPTGDLTYSGIGVVSGWECEAGALTVEFWDIDEDGNPTTPALDSTGAPLTFPLIYGNKRPDTMGVCGDTNNGYVAIFNYGELASGWHMARIFEDGAEIERGIFWSWRLGEQAFVPYAIPNDPADHVSCTVFGFPSGYATSFLFNPNTQHFEADYGCRWDADAGECIEEP